MVKIPVISMMVAIAEVPVTVSIGPGSSGARVSRTRAVGTALVSRITKGESRGLRSAVVVRPMQGVWALAEKEGKSPAAALAAGASTVFAETVAAKIGEERERKRRRRRIAI